MFHVLLSNDFSIAYWFDLWFMCHQFFHETGLGMKQCNLTVAPINRSAGKRPRGNEGFTLLEILVVVAILGLLIGLVAPAALRQLSGARNSVAKQSIERISSVLDLYKLDTGTYPTTDQGLAALVQKPSGIDNWNGP